MRKEGKEAMNRGASNLGDLKWSGGPVAAILATLWGLAGGTRRGKDGWSCQQGEILNRGMGKQHTYVCPFDFQFEFSLTRFV